MFILRLAIQIHVYMKLFISLFTACTVLFAFGQETEKFTLEDIHASAKYRPESVWGLRSMNDGVHYTSLARTKKGVALVKYQYKNGKAVDTLMQTASEEQLKRISGYSFSADEQKILVKTDVEKIYRRSTREHNFVYDRASQSFTKISKGGKQRLATFSPAGDKVAFVRKNNLFFIDLSTGEETQISKDGRSNEVIFGATDWVYEEEFAFSKAFFWSPDGKKIAYYRFDETEVKEFFMSTYGTLYPEEYKFKYPKAGENNSKVSIYVYNLEEKASMDLIHTSANEKEYIPRIKWTANADELAVMLMNRHQSDLAYMIANATTGSVKEVYREISETYIDVNDSWTFTPNNESMIFTSEISMFNHIHELNLNTGEMASITEGNFDVTDFYGYDHDSRTFYYASAANSPTQREIYKLKRGKKPTAITTSPGWNSAEFSKGMKYFINTHSSANQPPYISLHDANGKQIRVLKDNTELKERLAVVGLSPKEFFSFKTESGTELNAWAIKPLNFDKDKKYPVLVTIYGGPGSQTVKDQWAGTNYLWHQYLAQEGYIVVSVDNRGTGARGVQFKKSTHLQLGRLETEDYISFAKYLGSQSYIDAERIGIWGWSYGGYMSSLAITKGADHYKTAIAVAPVTTWRYYDSIYTERYMHTPEENPNGYDDNSPINHVEKMKGNYLLIHGNSDDNVHFQNSADMVSALVEANKQFDFMMYPNKNHGIYGGNTRLHLYTKMTDYLKENL